MSNQLQTQNKRDKNFAKIDYYEAEEVENEI